VPNWKSHLEAGRKAAQEAYRLDPNLSDANLAVAYEHLRSSGPVGSAQTRARARSGIRRGGARARMAYGLMGLFEKARRDIDGYLRRGK